MSKNLSTVTFWPQWSTNHLSLKYLAGLSVSLCENCESLCSTNVRNDENTWVLLRRTILLSYFEKRRGKMGKANSKLKGDTLDKLTADTYCEYYSKQQLQHPKSLKCETK